MNFFKKCSRKTNKYYIFTYYLYKPLNILEHLMTKSLKSSNTLIRYYENYQLI